MIRSVSFFIAIFVSLPATAQTTCSWVGQLWVCNNTAPVGGIEPYNYSKIMNDAQNLVPNSTEQDAALARQRAETQRLVEATERAEAEMFQRDKSMRLRQKIGTLAADGKCAEAIDVAMRTGDFSLAREVRDLCK